MPWAKATSSGVAVGSVAAAASPRQDPAGLAGRTELDDGSRAGRRRGRVVVAPSRPPTASRRSERGGAGDGRCVIGAWSWDYGAVIVRAEALHRPAAWGSPVGRSSWNASVHASWEHASSPDDRHASRAAGPARVGRAARRLRPRRDPRVGLAPGYFPWSRGRQQHGARRQRPARRAVRRPARQLRVRQLRPRLHRRPRHRRQLQRLPGVRHLRQRRAGAAAARSCAPAVRATSRCTGTCCSCPSRRPAAASTAAPRARRAP